MGLIKQQVSPLKELIQVKDRSQKDSKQNRHSPVGSEEKKKTVMLWEGILGKEQWVASKSWGPQSYNFKALNFVNNQ